MCMCIFIYVCQVRVRVIVCHLFVCMADQLVGMYLRLEVSFILVAAVVRRLSPWAMTASMEASLLTSISRTW